MYLVIKFDMKTFVIFPERVVLSLVLSFNFSFKLFFVIVVGCCMPQRHVTWMMNALMRCFGIEKKMRDHYQLWRNDWSMLCGIQVSS